MFTFCFSVRLFLILSFFVIYICVSCEIFRRVFFDRLCISLCLNLGVSSVYVLLLLVSFSFLLVFLSSSGFALICLSISTLYDLLCVELPLIIPKSKCFVFFPFFPWWGCQDLELDMAFWNEFVNPLIVCNVCAAEVCRLSIICSSNRWIHAMHEYRYSWNSKAVERAIFFFRDFVISKFIGRSVLRS